MTGPDSGPQVNIWEDRAMHRVVVLATDGVFPFELSVPTKLFGSPTNRAGERRYEVVTCTPSGGPVRTDGDFTITPSAGPEALTGADTVVVPPASWHTTLTRESGLPADVAPALAAIPPTARIVSICLGSYLVAAAGLLDGLPATTHWYWAEHFQQAFPQVRIDPHVLYVDAGRLFTSAGGAAGVDLCLHLIRQDHGSAVANTVARGCVVPPWRDGGQVQYVERAVPADHGGNTSATRAWALDRLHEPMQLDDLARHAGMSRRTFTRHFRADTGQSPTTWLLAQRIDLARHLLERTDLPVDQVAGRAGFGSPSALRKHLRQALRTSPTGYRRAFHV